MLPHGDVITGITLTVGEARAIRAAINDRSSSLPGDVILMGKLDEIVRKYRTFRTDSYAAAPGTRTYRLINTVTEKVVVIMDATSIHDAKARIEVICDTLNKEAEGRDV